MKMMSITQLITLAMAFEGLQSAAITKRTVGDGTGDMTTPGTHLLFGYNGLSGAAFWPSIARTCGGLVQSPINIEPSSIDFNVTIQGVMKNDGSYPAITFPSSAGKLKNYGDTIKFTPTTPSGTFTRPDGVYSMIQWHIHTPSEHRVNGIDYPAEVHFVHSKNGSLAVVGAFVDYGTTTSPFLQQMITTGTSLAAQASADFTANYDETVAAIKKTKSIYRYIGSLTTPPCTEGVKWHVASDPVFTITPDHLKLLKGTIKYSARDTQPFFDPYDTTWSTKRKSDYYTTESVAAAGGH